MNDDDKRRLENQLLVMGLSPLDNPYLIQQLGRLVQDHEMFLGLVNQCDQERRTEMYEAIRPHVKFALWPLQHYIDRLKEKGSVIASKENPIQVGERKYQEVSRALATGCILTLVCAKCTRTAQFHAETPVQAMIFARKKGWIRDLIREKEICPKCPAIRKKVGNA